MGLLTGGCGTEQFPGAPGGAGDLDVPYVTTYNFGFEVGFEPILGANGNLQIVSGADLVNLVSAANITRLPGTGVVGGRVFSTAGVAAADVALAATDVNGRRLGEFFYNSLGGTPDFVQTRGTTASGAFTAFNVATGEVFLTAVGGGRGGTRLLAFPDEVSLGTMVVTPVVIPILGVLGEITDDGGRAISTGGAGIGVEVVGQRLSEAANCADETPTQDRVDANQRGSGTFFRFCVASEGDYFARVTGGADFVPTYQVFNSNSSRLTALQTAELTEFFTVQTREGLVAAARAAGTTWDPTKGVLTGQVRYGAGAPRSSAVVRITDESGTAIAVPGGGAADMGALLYVDGAGRPIPGAQATGGSGRFVALNLPIPSGERSAIVYVTITAERPTAGVPERYVATSISPVFPNAVMFREIGAASAPPPIAGEDQFVPYFSGPISGRVILEDRLAPVPNARITTLGVPIAELPPPQQSQVFFADLNGRYDIPINSNPDATTPLLQNSLYLFKVEASDESVFPTYQRVRTGRSEVDPVTNRFRDATQNLIAVPRTAVSDYETTTLVLDEIERDTGRGILIGTAMEVGTDRPAAGITVRLTSVDGADTSSARIYYFDFGGIPQRNLTATTPDGRFIVFNAPVGTVSLDVTSPDDTGNALVDSRADGATVVRLDVSNAAPQTVDVSGRFSPLVGAPPSTTISLTAAGGDPMAIRQECPPDTVERGGLCYRDPANRQVSVPKRDIPCSEESIYGKHRTLRDGYCQLQFESAPPDNTFRVPIGSHRRTVLKTSGAGLVDTYTFGLQTADRAVGGVRVGVATGGALDTLATSAGLTRLTGPEQNSAVIWGRATAASLGEVDQDGDLVPLTCATWTRLPIGTLAGCEAVGIPGALATGSFNDDALRDLAIIDTSPSAPRVTIWLNTGEGVFLQVQEIGRDLAGCRIGDGDCGVEDGPVALIVVDYTRDGLSDIVVLNQGSRSISLFEGRGRGRFVFGGSLVVGSGGGPSPATMAVADFNRDQIPDLLIADISGQIGLLFGTGAGFQPPLPGVRVGNAPRAVLTGHLDFDNIPDLVFVNCDTISVMQRVGVTNTLTEYRLPGDVTPECDAADFSAAAIGDIDRSQFNDVVVADRGVNGIPRIWIFPNGPFGLGTPTSLQTAELPVALAAVDLNDDRALDLVVVHGEGTVLYQEGDGQGGFGPQFPFFLGGSPSTLVMDDVTGDGAIDAVLSDPGSERVVVLPQTTRPVGGIAIAAVQADGRAVGDVVYLNETHSPLAGARFTDSSGRFAIFNVPPGPIWLRLLTGGLGSRFLHAYPDAVSNTTFPVIRGETTTTTIRGITADSVLRPVGEVQIRFLGTQRATSSSPIQFDRQGNAVGGADYLAIVEANSDYVIKLSK